MPACVFKPTPEQSAAIHAVGGSVLVSAAAGSGKTAVLAERCAYLVCDAPPEQRCDVDQLLVLTFTEAAAAEMRGRIVDCIRARLEAKPADRRLREQMALVSAARLMALKLGSGATATDERLRTVGSLGLIGPEDLNGLIDAQALLLRLILEQQIADLAAGREPGSKIDPDALNRRDRDRLKAALKHLDLLPDMIQGVLTSQASLTQVQTPA